MGVLLGLVFALVMIGGCETDATDADIVVVQLSEVKALTTGPKASTVLLVDPRAPLDFNAGHIAGAKNYQLNSERSRTGEGLNPLFRGYKHIFVYGEDPSSGTAKAMTKRLLNAGADGVRMYAGGMVEWRRSGLPIEKVETPASPPAAKPGEAPPPSPK
jgi:rhodanese-related sulfurtransferase